MTLIYIFIAIVIFILLVRFGIFILSYLWYLFKESIGWAVAIGSIFYIFNWFTFYIGAVIGFIIGCVIGLRRFIKKINEPKYESTSDYDIDSGGGGSSSSDDDFAYDWGDNSTNDYDDEINNVNNNSDNKIRSGGWNQCKNCRFCDYNPVTRSWCRLNDDDVYGDDSCNAFWQR